DGEGELHRAGVAELPVEAVVTAGGGDEVLLVDRATEPLEGVVEAPVGLEVVEDGAAADAVLGEDVQLVVRAQLDARELDAGVGEEPAVVVRVGAAERDTRESLGETLAAGAVDRRPAVEHETAPVALEPGARGLVAREEERMRRRARAIDR